MNRSLRITNVSAASGTSTTGVVADYAT
jgi:hypothetical protein